MIYDRPIECSVLRRNARRFSLFTAPIRTESGLTNTDSRENTQQAAIHIHTRSFVFTVSCRTPLLHVASSHFKCRLVSVKTSFRDSINKQKWRVLSRLLVSPPEEKLPGNNWPPKPLVRVHLQPAASRSLIVTGPVP